MKAFVYRCVDASNGKIYIGFKVGDFFKIAGDTYRTSSKIVKQLMKERPQDFTWQLIACGSKEEMVNFESYLLKSIDAANNPLYYNLSNGVCSFAGNKHSLEFRAKTSVFFKGKKKPAEHRAKIGIAHTGMKRSPETCRNIGAAKLGFHHSPEARAKMTASRSGSKNHFFGKKHSVQTLEKMRSKQFSPEYRQKISIGRKKYFQRKAAGVLESSI